MPMVKMPTGILLRVTQVEYEDTRYMQFLSNLSRHHLRMRLRQIGRNVGNVHKEEDHSQAA